MAVTSGHQWATAEELAPYHLLDGILARTVHGAQLSFAVIDLDPYDAEADMTSIIGAWLPLTFAMNSLNRAMGNPDLYPFVLSPTVMTKLGFVHDVVHRRRGG